MTTRLIQPTKRGADISKLNPNQRLFVEYLLADEKFNPTNAATRAGYKAPAQAGTKLLKQPEIRAALGKALYERITECKIEAAQVLRHLASALFLDPLDLFEITEDKGTFRVKDLNEVPAEVRRCITKMKCRTKTFVTEDGEETTETYIEIELMSKDACLALAMKHLGLVDGNLPTKATDATEVIGKLLEEVESGPSNTVDGSVIERIAERL